MSVCLPALTVAVVLAGCGSAVAESPGATPAPSAATSTSPGETAAINALQCPDEWRPDWSTPTTAAGAPASRAGLLVPDGVVADAIWCDYGFQPTSAGQWPLVSEREFVSELQRRIDTAYGRFTPEVLARGGMFVPQPLQLVIGQLADGTQIRTLSWGNYPAEPPWRTEDVDLNIDIAHTDGTTICVFTPDQYGEQWLACPPPA